MPAAAHSFITSNNKSTTNRPRNDSLEVDLVLWHEINYAPIHGCGITCQFLIILWTEHVKISLRKRHHLQQLQSSVILQLTATRSTARRFFAHHCGFVTKCPTTSFVLQIDREALSPSFLPLQKPLYDILPSAANLGQWGEQLLIRNLSHTESG